MKPGAPTGRVDSLVVELGTGTAIVGGQRIEIPRGEFELLAALAARSGQTVSSKDLLHLLWPGDAVATEVDLRGRVYRLRRRIGDLERDEKIVANRPGFGYLIDLPPGAIEVVGRLTPPEEPSGEVIVLDGDTADANTATPESGTFATIDTSVSAPPEIPLTGSRSPRVSRPLVVGITAMVVSALLAGSWWAGTWLSDTPSAVTPQAHSNNVPVDADDPDRRRPRSVDRAKDDKTGPVKPPAQSSDEVNAQQPTTVAVGPGTPPESDRDSESSPKRAAKTSVPQPDARLFHLFDPDTGDHFATINQSAANQKQAAGYTSTTEGWVFSAQSKGTISITLDGSTAFIYRDAATAPGSIEVVALYRLASSTDFFFTSSSAQANQAEAQGWTRSVAGYVGQ